MWMISDNITPIQPSPLIIKQYRQLVTWQYEAIDTLWYLLPERNVDLSAVTHTYVRHHRRSVKLPVQTSFQSLSAPNDHSASSATVLQWDSSCNHTPTVQSAADISFSFLLRHTEICWGWVRTARISLTVGQVRLHVMTRGEWIVSWTVSNECKNVQRNVHVFTE